MESKARKYRSESEWRNLIEEQEDSSKSMTQFCEEHGIASSNYYKWRRRLFGQSSKNSRSFKKLEPASAFALSSSKIELELPAGIKLSISL